MKRLLLLILVLSACDGAELPTAPTAIAPAAPDEGSLVEQSARAFIKALQKCDREQATAGTLTFEEISSIAKRQVDKADWDRGVNDFIDSHCKEYAGSTIDIRINRRDHLRADEHGKMKRDIDVAFVIPKVDDATRPSAPLTFIKTERGWKFTPER